MIAPLHFGQQRQTIRVQEVRPGHPNHHTPMRLDHDVETVDGMDISLTWQSLQVSCGHQTPRIKTSHTVDDSTPPAGSKSDYSSTTGMSERGIPTAWYGNSSCLPRAPRSDSNIQRASINTRVHSGHSCHTRLSRSTSVFVLKRSCRLSIPHHHHHHYHRTFSLASLPTWKNTRRRSHFQTDAPSSACAVATCIAALPDRSKGSTGEIRKFSGQTCASLSIGETAQQIDTQHKRTVEPAPGQDRKPVDHKTMERESTHLQYFSNIPQRSPKIPSDGSKSAAYF